MTKARDIASATTPNANAALLATFPHKNLIINGAMQVSQRGTSFTGFGAAVNYGIDRFANFHSSDGAFTISQETSVVPTDFTHALKIQTTTADASIAAGQRLIVFTRCEGNVVSQLNWGTSAAKTVTLSFYVRSSITGTHGGAFGNGSDDRNYPFTYTINSADTWERKTITVAGDTSGTWATGTGRSLQVVWGLGVGSTYSGTAGAWASGDINSATGATTGVLGTLNATWYLTGVQLEVSSTATPFEHRSYGDELAKCQRYYSHSGFHSGTPYGGGGLAMYALNVSEAGGTVTFPTTMRAGPTIRTKDSAGNIGGIHRAAVGDVTSGVSVQWPSNAESNKVGFSGLTKSNAWATGNMLIGVWDATAEL